MKNKNYYWLILIALLAVTSCKKSHPTTPTGNTGATGSGGIDIYAAGIIADEINPLNTQATIWKNGVATALSPISSSAISIAVHGSDVYVAGYEFVSNSGTIGKRLACYWKNGIKIPLAADDHNSQANAIVVVGNDVYIAGMSPNPVYWKNGIISTLEGTGTPSGILVQGNDVYISGYTVNQNFKDLACYWKNGVIKKVEGTLTESRAFSIALSGTDVYIAGYAIRGYSESDTVAVWKNGIQTTRLPINSPISSATGIAIVNGHTYLSGNGSTFATSWTDGITTPLQNSNNTRAYCITVNGSDVYIGGSYFKSNDFHGNCAGYWKNGVLTQLNSTNNSAVYSMAIGNK